jgi:hypothetical protein
VTRAVLAILSCSIALVVGVYTACLSARNRARGSELDRRQHECETLTRQNELLRATNAEADWQLIHGEERVDESGNPIQEAALRPVH